MYFNEILNAFIKANTKFEDFNDSYTLAAIEYVVSDDFIDSCCWLFSLDYQLKCKECLKI